MWFLVRFNKSVWFPLFDLIHAIPSWFILFLGSFSSWAMSILVTWFKSYVSIKRCSNIACFVQRRASCTLNTGHFVSKQSKRSTNSYMSWILRPTKMTSNLCSEPLFLFSIVPSKIMSWRWVTTLVMDYFNSHNWAFSKVIRMRWMYGYLRRQPCIHLKHPPKRVDVLSIT